VTITPRGPSAKAFLKIEWDYPVWEQAEEVSEDGRTSASRARRALSREEAIKHIAGDDPRPLLVLRECKVCNGTDDALLKGGSENERTFLLSRWFHCVKLPVDVMEDNHPYHNIFATDPMEHLFVVAVDGSEHTPLESETSRVELWDSMSARLKSDYKKRPDTALRSAAKLLDQFDIVDQKIHRLLEKRDQILEEDGPKSRKLKKVVRDIENEKLELEELTDKMARASELELKRKVAPAAKAGAEK